MRSGPSSQLARPFCHSSAWLAAKSSGDIFLRAASLSSIHGRKSPGSSFGNASSRFAKVALGIDRNRRNAVERGFFQQRQAKPRLAAAGHADANGVRRQILAVVQQRLGAGLLFRNVVRPTEEERTRFIDFSHGSRRPIRKNHPPTSVSEWSFMKGG